MIHLVLNQSGRTGVNHARASKPRRGLCDTLDRTRTPRGRGWSGCGVRTKGRRKPRGDTAGVRLLCRQARVSSAQGALDTAVSAEAQQGEETGEEIWRVTRAHATRVSLHFGTEGGEAGGSECAPPSNILTVRAVSFKPRPWGAPCRAAFPGTGSPASTSILDIGLPGAARGDPRPSLTPSANGRTLVVLQAFHATHASRASEAAGPGPHAESQARLK